MQCIFWGRGLDKIYVSNHLFNRIKSNQPVFPFKFIEVQSSFISLLFPEVSSNEEFENRILNKNKIKFQLNSKKNQHTLK